MAILLAYGIDTSVRAARSKGNFDQMKAEVENLSGLSEVYLLTMDKEALSSLFNNNVIHLPCGLSEKRNTLLSKFIRYLFFSFAGFKSISMLSDEIEVIISQGTLSLHATFASILFRKPYVLFLHYLAHNEQMLLGSRILSLILKKIETFNIRHANCVIALNESLKTKALEYGVKEAITIPNFIDLNEIAQLGDRNALRFKFKFENNLKVVLFVGRLHPVKNVGILIKSFIRLKTSNKILIILGDGPEKKSLSCLTHNLGISDKVFFEGFKPRRVALEFMKACDVLVLPSLVEGQPRVVLEAWGCGLPVVASKVNGLENLINDRVDGLFFKNNSVEDLAKMISEALNNKTASAIRLNAKKRIDEYTVENVLSKQEIVVKKFLKAKNN